MGPFAGWTDVVVGEQLADLHDRPSASAWLGGSARAARVP